MRLSADIQIVNKFTKQVGQDGVRPGALTAGTKGNLKPLSLIMFELTRISLQSYIIVYERS